METKTEVSKVSQPNVNSLYSRTTVIEPIATPNMVVSTAAMRARFRRIAGLVPGPVGQRTVTGARMLLVLIICVSQEDQVWVAPSAIPTCFLFSRAVNWRSLVSDSGTMRKRNRKKEAWRPKAM